MPDNVTPNPADVNPAGGGAPADASGTPPPAIDAIETLKQKKGWKTNEEVVTFAEEAEKSYSREQNKVNKVKQQLEGAGYILDDEGNIKPSGQPAGQPPGYPPSGQPSQEPVYDPYTGQVITDPIALQLARMPVGQREVFIFNAMQNQRETQQTSAFQADQEVLSKLEAKGFEDDVRKVMQSLPLAQRADKKEWERALLQVKGARYDLDKKNWAQQGVGDFLNREVLQVPAGAGGAGGGTALTQDQEQSYQWYQKNQPGMFKDRTHFAKALSPTGGR